MKRMKKMMSILLVLGMLATLMVAPQIASAELEEEVIYFEDFNNVTSEQKTAWHETFDAATAKPGQWYLYSGDVYAHNIALGKTGFPSNDAIVPILFGQEIDIEKNKYELTFKYDHVAGEDTLWMASPTVSANKKDQGYAWKSGDPVKSWDTGVYEIKVIFEGKKWTFYRDGVQLGYRDSSTNIIDGIVLKVFSGNTNIHSVDNLCLKQIDKTTGAVIDTLYNETFDDWTNDGEGKTVAKNICALERYSDFESKPQPYLIPTTYGSTDGLVGYIQKSGHTDNKDNILRFVFPEVLNKGQYIISFDYSTAKQNCDWIYLHDPNGQSVAITDGNTSYAAKGFRSMKLLIDTDEGTYQLNDGTVKEFPEGKFETGVSRIAFRQHTDAGVGRTTLVDNFKIVKLVEKEYTISDKDIVITNSEGFAQSNKENIDINLGNIAVDFSKELDETTVNKTNVVFSGGNNPEYDVKYENNQIIVSLVSGKLELGTNYTLSINNVMADGNIPVLSKEFSFKTNDAEFVRTQVYSENFNNVSVDTLTSWGTQFETATAVKGQWYSKNTTPALVENTDANDKALSTAAHVNGTADNLYFKLPGNITSDGISRYEISFEYYANGDWSDWFYLRNDNDVYSRINMDFTKGWHSVAMTIDLVNQTWTVNGAKCTDEKMASTLDKSDLIFAFSLHASAAKDSVIKVDNFNVYKLSEKYELSNDTFTVSESNFATENGKTTANVKLAINKSGEYKFTALIAAYESDNTLQNVVSIPVSTSFSDSTKVIEGLTVDSDNNTDYCKVFIWNMADGNFIPLVEAISSK